MKKVILYLIVLIHCSAVFGQVGLPRFPDSLFTTYYHQRISLFKRLPQTFGDNIFLGNSITDGGEWAELFNDLSIKNRGISGDHTIGVLNRLDEIIARKPSKLFLMIGVNDLRNGMQPDTVVKNILQIGSIIKNHSPNTKLYIQSILPVNESFGKFVTHTNKKAEILEVNRQLHIHARSIPYTYIDLFSDFADATGRLNVLYTNDGLHLTGPGYIKWKEAIYKYLYDVPISLPKQDISKNYSYSTAPSNKLQLPDIFTDSLVFQQNMDIPVWGTSCRNCLIKISFNKKSLTTKADKNGHWKIKLPAIKAGGPHTMKISDKNSSITLSEILIGEVWLCSGQSNMEFTLSQSQYGTDEMKNANYPQIRLFRMTAHEKARPIANRVYSDSLLNEMKNGNFYTKSNWTTCNPITAAQFSAVAYHFGKELHQKINVPIGLISNAVGGTTTQSFIDSITLASHPQLVQFVGNKQGKTWIDTATDIHPWVKERVIENLGWNVKDKSFIHPFAPTFLFNQGIRPIASYGIKGVIWYQGESNATHPEIHDALFTSLVKNWRTIWQQGNFPFYAVQLPKISNRSRWPEFRESQRKLSESIENSGMIVTIDSGDSLDVHPKEKKMIGQRLSLLALAKTYNLATEYSGPVYTKYELKPDALYLYFNHANVLKADNKVSNEIKGFYLYGVNKSGTQEIIMEAKNIRIIGSKLIIPITDGIQIKSVKYAWVPYPICNLVNEAGLPAGPFKVELVGNF